MDVAPCRSVSWPSAMVAPRPRPGSLPGTGPALQGQPTASGDVFDPNGYTAAHKTLPFGTQLTVSYGGRSDAGHGQRPGSVRGGPGSRPLPGRGRTPRPDEGRRGLRRLHRDGQERLRSQASYRLRCGRGGRLFEGPRKQTGCFGSDWRATGRGGPGTLRAEGLTTWCRPGDTLWGISAATRYLRAPPRRRQRYSEP